MNSGPASPHRSSDSSSDNEGEPSGVSAGQHRGSSKKGKKLKREPKLAVKPLKVSGAAAGKPPLGADSAFTAAWRRTTGDLSEPEQRRAVVQALEVFQLLPASSTYAAHRIRVLQKALELLDKAARRGGGGRVFCVGCHQSTACCQCTCRGPAPRLSVCPSLPKPLPALLQRAVRGGE